jgi:hypothetical protein
MCIGHIRDLPLGWQREDIGIRSVTEPMSIAHFSAA